MRLRVSENGLVIPPYLLAGLDEVEVSRQGDVISIEKVDKTSAQETIDISLLKGEVAEKLLAEKLKQIRESNQNQSPNPAKVALAENFRQLCREIQELQADNPLSEAEIAAEIDAVRRGE